MAQMSFLILFFHFDFWFYEEAGRQQTITFRAILGISPDTVERCFPMVSSSYGIVPSVYDFYLDYIFAFLQGSCNLHFIRCCPGNAIILDIDPDMGNILHIVEREPSTALWNIIFLQLQRRCIAGMSAEVAYPVILMLTPIEKLDRKSVV